MDREFEATFDSQGHFDLPIEVRQRHGLTNGARVKIEDRKNEVVIKPVVDDNERKRIALEAIDRAVGFLGSDSNTFQAIMNDKKVEREREDHRFQANASQHRPIDKAVARQALEKAVGFMGNDGRALKSLMEERRRERRK